MPKWTAKGDWVNTNNGTNQDCNENNEPICDMGPGVIGPNLPDDIDIRIMQDSMPHAEWQYTGARRLMQRIAEDPELLEDTDLADFYGDAMASYLGDWHDVDQQIHNAWDDVALCAEAEERESLTGMSYAETLKVQPNPASDHISIMTAAKAGASLRLIDMFGRVGLQQPYMGYGQRLDTDGLPTGRYVLQLVSQEGKVNITALQIAR